MDIKPVHKLSFFNFFVLSSSKKNINLNTFFSKKNNKGFTLLELLVVIAMIAIVGSIAMVSSGDMLANSRLKSDARQLRSEIMKAKLMAVNTNSEVEINITKKDTSSNGKLEVKRDTDGNGNKDLVEEIKLDKGSANEIEDDLSFEFNSRGRPDITGSSETFDIKNNKGKSFTIEISLTGRVEIK